MTIRNVIYVETLPGNFFDAKRFLNKHDLADNLICMDYSGNYTLVVLRIPEDHELVVEDEKRIAEARKFAESRASGAT